MFNRIITSNMEIETRNKYTSGVWRGIFGRNIGRNNFNVWSKIC